MPSRATSRDRAGRAQARRLASSGRVESSHLSCGKDYLFERERIVFRHQGPSRSTRQNVVLASYLALLGGFVNAVGFVLMGRFSSHVTGAVGAFAHDVVRHEPSGWDAVMVLVFLCGAALASVIVESGAFANVARAYGTALCGEALLLVLVVVARPSGTLGWPICALAAAMGMQNSMVTRLSGAVVRTTHLTGVVTDIGIELARWFHWWRTSWSSHSRVRLSVSKSAERPSVPKLLLLVTIAAAFTLGALAGALAGARAQQWALLLPIVALALGALFAFTSRERP